MMLTESLSNFLASLRDAFDNLGAPDAPREIEPPVYFHYLDSARVDALYSQVQPELEEKERTVGRSSGIRGEAKAGFGGANVGGEAGRAAETKSILARTGFSAERKCIELIRNVRNASPERYYSSDSDWYLRRTWKAVGPSVGKLWAQPIDPDKVKAITQHLQRQAQRGAAQSEIELKAELESLEGLVLVSGEFEQTISDGSITLVERFSSRSFGAAFRAFLPEDFEPLPASKPLRLTVFAQVIKPLGPDGFVDLKCIAVYWNPARKH